MPTTEDFRRTIRRMFADAAAQGRSDILVVAGDFHKAAQPGPDAPNRMPAVCNVMYQEKQGSDVIEYAPPKGRGPHLSIRYRLPRSDGAVRRAATASRPPQPPQAVAPASSRVVASGTRPTAPAAGQAPLLVVLPCTKCKAVTHPDALTWDNFGDPARRARRARREARLAPQTLPARDMYSASDDFRTAIAAVDAIRCDIGPRSSRCASSPPVMG